MALAWALVELDGARRRSAIALLIPMAVFLIPFDVGKSVGNRTPYLLAMSRTWWWQSLLAPHYAWGLLALTIAILAALPRRAVFTPKADQVLNQARGNE